MGEQILHYYLKIFNFILIIFFILISIYIFNLFTKNIILKNNPISIDKNEKIEDVLKKNVNNIKNIDISLIKIYFLLNNLINKKYFHYGKFNIENNTSFINFINIISKPSNILLKITIVEGWSQKQLDLELSNYFSDYYSIPYQDIIADTYFLQQNGNFDNFIKKLKSNKSNYFKKYFKNNLLNRFSENQIMTIGSLIEKEGLDDKDKKNISSVIFNRLNKGMKLQIDATVLFAITNGNYDLGRKLLIRDLKTDHPFNTYKITGLPPEPISYVGKKTLDIIFENNKSDFLFYFFNYSLNRHIFSKTFKEHKKKLNEYKSK